MSGPRASPHPLALFSLKPLNRRAEDVVRHPCNSHLASQLKDGTLALDVGLHIRSTSCSTLATLGRGVTTDIFVEGSSIAKIQCSFEMDLDTNIVMLYDRSYGQSTQLIGENAYPFEHGRLRKVVVQEKLNNVFGMGGVGKNLVLFELKWHQDASKAMETANRGSIVQGFEENPRLARTVDETATVLPSQRATRPHTPGPRQLRLRYRREMKLGTGQFGAVYKAIDVDTGKPIAVKILQQPERASKEEEWRQSMYYILKREVEILSEISHPNIVDYIASQGWDGPEVEIFMGLKEGTLESLVKGWESSITDIDIAQSVFHHMLQALDFLSSKGIVHRDVKPENILYISRPGGHYQFQLGDFGLSNRAISAATCAGSPIYMAPEMFRNGAQTHKVDVWSLFVTMLWTLDIKGFRQQSTCFKTQEDVQKAVSTAASTDRVEAIKEMARVDSGERASAAQMLIKCFDGEGLISPRNEVPAISPSRAETNASFEVSRAPTTRPTHRPNAQGPRIGPDTAMGRFRVRKHHVPVQAQLLRQDLVTRKRLERANGPATRRRRIPGGFPDDDVHSLA